MIKDITILKYNSNNKMEIWIDGKINLFKYKNYMNEKSNINEVRFAILYICLLLDNQMLPVIFSKTSAIADLFEFKDISKDVTLKYIKTNLKYSSKTFQKWEKTVIIDRINILNENRHLIMKDFRPQNKLTGLVEEDD